MINTKLTDSDRRLQILNGFRYLKHHDPNSYRIVTNVLHQIFDTKYVSLSLQERVFTNTTDTWVIMNVIEIARIVE